MKRGRGDFIRGKEQFMAAIITRFFQRDNFFIQLSSLSFLVPDFQQVVAVQDFPGQIHGDVVSHSQYDLA